MQASSWSPDGKFIASASADTTVRVWDATTGRTIAVYRGHTDIVYGVNWSPDGTRVASASNDGTIKLWSVALPGQQPRSQNRMTSKKPEALQLHSQVSMSAPS
ncbi:WD40 repeat domain-containing protein [Dictyobacter kobayashii]|uniref:WD40 repeat domain-containing protein n=1 Tax=Dictyobacter kobayashii TaxID=2014872 RepID=UPI00138724BF|nr:PD40 domain-containing protein [Dictyobacter kobayashii]